MGKKLLFLVQLLLETITLDKGGPTFSSLGPRIVFLLEPRAKKPLLALLFKTNRKFTLSLKILIQK
jgi:hypothetical protein